MPPSQPVTFCRMDRNIMPLVLTVTEAIEDDDALETRMSSPLHAMVMQAAVHAWMEGHLAAPSHVLRDEPTGTEMPAPPFPARDDERLREIIAIAGDYSKGEEPAAVMAAAAAAWRAGRQDGLDCPGCALPKSSTRLAQQIRGGHTTIEFKPGAAAN
jgi:hypothetical protein